LFTLKRFDGRIAIQNPGLAQYRRVDLLQTGL
jgi:hypothetical protein